MTETEEERKARVHVDNVRLKDGKFLVVLSDKSLVEWGVWCSLSESERKGKAVFQE